MDWEAGEVSLDQAIATFTKTLPGWWFSVGLCHVSADASCAPDSAGVDAELLNEKLFDDGFHADLLPPATMADALLEVMAQAVMAKGERG
jgi:hypothetical protein